MAEHERSSTNHQRATLLDSASGLFRNPERSDHHHDSHKVENRSDREFRTTREERASHQEHPQADKVTNRGRRHSQYDYSSDRNHYHYDKSEDRYSGSTRKHHRLTPHDRLNSHSHERFDEINDAFNRREVSDGHRTTNSGAANERRRSYHTNRAQEDRSHQRYDRKDEPNLRKLVHEKRRHRDSEYLQKHHDKEEQEYQKSRSLACAPLPPSSDVTSLKPGHKFDEDNTDDLNEQMDQQLSAAYRRSEHHRRGHHHTSSRGRPSSRRGSFSNSSPSASDDSDDSRGTGTPKEGSFFRQPQYRGRHRSRSRSRSHRRSPSHSGSRTRSESHHRGRSRSRSPGENHSSVDKYSRSSHSHKHSSKRKHKDQSTSRDDRKRRKRKEREREKDKEKEKEKTKKKDEERRSVLTGKKIKLKVKKDKGDHERDANRKDLLHFLNSAFE